MSSINTIFQGDSRGPLQAFGGNRYYAIGTTLDGISITNCSHGAVAQANDVTMFGWPIQNGGPTISEQLSNQPSL